MYSLDSLLFIVTRTGNAEFGLAVDGMAPKREKGGIVGDCGGGDGTKSVPARSEDAFLIHD